MNSRAAKSGNSGELTSLVGATSLLARTSPSSWPKLIGELRPGTLANVDDDPRRAAAVGRVGCRSEARKTSSRSECCMRSTTRSAERGSMLTPIAGKFDGRGGADVDMSSSNAWAEFSNVFRRTETPTST